MQTDISCRDVWRPRRSTLIPRIVLLHVAAMTLIVMLSLKKVSGFWLARPPNLK